MMLWKKFLVGGAITVAAVGSSSAYAYACGHRPPHRPPHKPPHSTTTTTTTPTTIPSTTIPA